MHTDQMNEQLSAGTTTLAWGLF